MIPQYSWCCDGMRVRAPTDAASEKARDRGEAKRQYAAQQMDLPSRTDASNRKHFLCRPAAPLQAPTRRVSKATNGVTPGPLHSRRRVVQGFQPPTLRHQRHPRTALPSPPRPQRCPKSSNKGAAPRPPRPWHQHEADPGAQKKEIRPKLQLFCDCELPRGFKRGLTPGKAANRTHSGPFPPRGGRKGVRNRKKVAQKSEFLFLRNGSSQRSNSCERHVCLQCQSGRAAARNHSASTIQALMPSPLAKIPR